MPSHISTPTAQQILSNIAVDGSAASPHKYASGSVDVTMDKTSPMVQRVLNPGAAKTVTLPTTDIKAGYQVILRVMGATETNYVVLKSSGAEEITRIGGEGTVHVMANTDTPTTAAHWTVLNVNETNVTLSLTMTGAVASTAYTIYASRNNDVVTLRCPTFSVAGNNTGNNITSGAGTIPARFSPVSASTDRKFYGLRGTASGTAVNTIRGTVHNTGYLRFFIDDSNFSASTSNHGWQECQLTYLKTAAG